jgi:hypothetical protein
LYIDQGQRQSIDSSASGEGASDQMTILKVRTDVFRPQWLAGVSLNS